MALEPNQEGVNEFTDFCKEVGVADDGGKSGCTGCPGGRRPVAILQRGRRDLLEHLLRGRPEWLFTE